MKTRLPISTIAFNTPLYFIHKLEELREGGIITKWYVMPHAPEDDEAGKKWHMHTYIEPAKSISTDDLQNELKEFDPSHPTKPRGVLPFRTSKFGDWYFYAKHDMAYLYSKGEARKYTYAEAEFLVYDRDAFNFDKRTISRPEYAPIQRLQSMVESGQSFAACVARGFVPVNQMRNYEVAYRYLVEHFDRVGTRDFHEQFINPDTGEVVEMQKHPSSPEFETIHNGLAAYIFGSGSDDDAEES